MDDGISSSDDEPNFPEKHEISANSKSEKD